MDWIKAKNVLIAIFILLNVFLAVNLVLFYHGDSAEGQNTINAVKILEARGVVLKCKIPEITDSYRISYENASLDKNNIAVLLLDNGKESSYNIKYGKPLSKNSKSLVFHDDSSFTYTDGEPREKVDLSNKEKIVKYCIKLLDSLNLPVSEYYVDSYDQQTNGSISIVFKEKNTDYIIFTNEFSIELSEGGVTKLTSKLVKADKKQSNKDNYIVPAYQILLRHYIDDDNVIVGIDIGFDCKYVEQGVSSSTYPIWRVRTEDGNERYFSAIDGSEQEM